MAKNQLKSYLNMKYLVSFFSFRACCNLKKNQIRRATKIYHLKASSRFPSKCPKPLGLRCIWATKLYAFQHELKHFTIIFYQYTLQCHRVEPQLRTLVTCILWILWDLTAKSFYQEQISCSKCSDSFFLGFFTSSILKIKKLLGHFEVYWTNTKGCQL